MRLLLVDDDPGLRELLRTTFEVFEVELDEADERREAARRISARKPDVIVLDVLMPGTTGSSSAAELKATPRRATSPSSS